MGLFKVEQRAGFVSEPPIPSNASRGRFGFASRGVNLTATESSLQKVAVYASVRLLREVVTMLPLDFLTGSGATRAKVRPPSWLLDPAGDGYGLQDWLGQVTYCDAMRGNVVARVVDRGPNYEPTQLVLQHPDDVSVRRGGDGRPEWTVSGVRVDDSQDVWHRRSFPVPGAIWGLSPISVHALTIGLGISAEKFGAQFFTDGGHPTALFQNTERTIDPTQSATIKERIKAVLAGSREPLVLGSDWTYKPLQLPPGEAQFLETNNYTSSECARIFGPGMPAVLGYETGGSLTYANIEQFNQELLTFTLDPWLVRLERMVAELLPLGEYAKFNRGALLRTDLLTRYQAHALALQNEFEVINEVRDLEDMSPVPWGDEPTDKQKTLPATPPSASTKGTP